MVVMGGGGQRLPDRSFAKLVASSPLQFMLRHAMIEARIESLEVTLHVHV